MVVLFCLHSMQTAVKCNNGCVLFAQRANCRQVQQWLSCSVCTACKLPSSTTMVVVFCLHSMQTAVKYNNGCLVLFAQRANCRQVQQWLSCSVCTTCKLPSSTTMVVVFCLHAVQTAVKYNNGCLVLFAQRASNIQGNSGTDIAQQTSHLSHAWGRYTQTPGQPVPALILQRQTADRAVQE